MSGKPRAAVGDAGPKSPKNVDLHVGTKVRQRRLETRMTQQALADAIGLTFQQVQKYEQAGNRISASTLVAISAALGVNPGYFLDDAPGAIGAPIRSDWQEAMRIVATVSGAIDALRHIASLPPGERVIAIHTLSLMAAGARASGEAA